MRKARVMPAWERIQGHEAGMRTSREATQEEVLIFVFVENKIPWESISVSNGMIPD
jgi:hypothetical protein